jgi:hypothetical protein
MQACQVTTGIWGETDGLLLLSHDRFISNVTQALKLTSEGVSEVIDTSINRLAVLRALIPSRALLTFYIVQATPCYVEPMSEPEKNNHEWLIPTRRRSTSKPAGHPNPLACRPSALFDGLSSTRMVSSTSLP